MTKSGIRKNLLSLLAGGVLLAGAGSLNADDGNGLENRVSDQPHPTRLRVVKYARDKEKDILTDLYADAHSKLLWALNQVEASGKEFVSSRYEQGLHALYLKNNKQWDEKKQSAWKEKIDKFGLKAVFSSYGPWQMSYVKASEMGYKGRPQDLADPEVSLPYVVRYVEHLNEKFNGDLRKIASAYNGGVGAIKKDKKGNVKFINPEYVRKVIGSYKKAPQRARIYGINKEYALKS